jgi:hypothetical protein
VVISFVVGRPERGFLPGAVFFCFVEKWRKENRKTLKKGVKKLLKTLDHMLL